MGKHYWTVKRATRLMSGDNSRRIVAEQKQRARPLFKCNLKVGGPGGRSAVARSCSPFRQLIELCVDHRAVHGSVLSIAYERLKFKSATQLAV